MSEVTIFRSIKDVNTPFFKPVEAILERIRDGKSRDLVKKIREEKDKAKRDELKKALPAICFSGRFSKRDSSSIIEHSGIICLDFDNYERTRDMLAEKERLTKDKYVMSVFVSPSGNGLKVLVKIPADVDKHQLYFNALSQHFNSPNFDKKTKDLARVCYESFDPLLFYNPKSSIWETFSEPEYREVIRNVEAPTIPISDENKIVKILVKWWEDKFPMVEGQRNHNVYVLASALNDFGVNTQLAEYVLMSYRSSDFDEAEIRRTIESAYSKKENFGTKYYEDEDRVNSVRIKVRKGIPGNAVKDELVEEGLSEQIAEAVIKRIQDEAGKQVFWSKNDKGAVKIIHILFKQFLEDNGFYKFYPEGGRSYVFVRVTNNLVDHTSEKEIKDFVLRYLLDIEDVSVYNYFADQTRFFKEDFLSMLDTIDIYFIGDTSESSYLYYKNCAVRVDKDDVVLIDYIDLGGYVWKDHVIDRSYSERRVAETDYRKFIANICANDSQRVSAMESTIGFLLHGHKNLSYCPAVILNDEVISDNPEGGTGKGIFMNALGHMKKVVTIDGKSFNFERSFAYQLVSADTQIIVFDDVKRHFDFERLFSVITEGLTLEKKNKDAIKIPFAKSPKIAMTTNYAIRGVGNSFERRKWELELHQYYRKDYTPYDEFGKLMFGDWDDDEWLAFDHYMIHCLQGYMNTGLVKSRFVNLSIRQLSAETSHEFIEWCGLISGTQPAKLLQQKGKIYKQDLYFDFINEYPDYGPKSKMTISRTRFYRWINAYAIFKYGVAPEEGRDMSSRWLRFRSKHELETQQDLGI